MKITTELRLLALLARAEAAGEELTNDQIADAFGYASADSVSRHIKALRRHGLITAIYPDGAKRELRISAAGRDALAGAAHLDLAPMLPSARHAGPPVPATGPNVQSLVYEQRLERSTAARANDRFLAALAKVAPVPDAVCRDTGRFTRLPPPALSGQACS
jgi:DNA-binding transcriptional ArsR family regulator